MVNPIYLGEEPAPTPVPPIVPDPKPWNVPPPRPVPTVEEEEPAPKRRGPAPEVVCPGIGARGDQHEKSCVMQGVRL